jgi:hypothetical protein
MYQFRTSTVLLLPTDKETHLFKDANELYFNEEPDFSDPISEGHHLYILSDDVPGKGEWGMRGSYIFFQNTDGGGLSVGAKKIIATTDETLRISIPQGYGMSVLYEVAKIPEKFIMKYIKKYNKRKLITEVLVEYVQDMTSVKKLDNGLQTWDYLLRVNADDSIVIHKHKKV